MKRFVLILSFIQLLTAAGRAQTELTDYHPGITADGAVYFLPKTNIRVSVLVEKRTYTPGDFCKYAMRFLRLTDIGQHPTTSYRVIGISQMPVAVADTAKGYSVKINAKTVAPNIALSQDGRLLAINAQPSPEKEPQLFVAAPKAQLPNPRSFMSEEILSAGSTAKMAELTAREIYDLRENQNLLIKGQADFMPNDGAQMQLMLNQLSRQDKALTSLFAGTTTCDTTETILYVNPQGTIQHQVLFRLSRMLGLVDADDLSGEPYYIDVVNLKTVPSPVDDGKKKKKKQPESGIYVNVPGRMRSTIYQGNQPLDTKEMAAPQFGNVELLSAELFNKRYTTHLRLHPLSGAIEKLEAETPKK